MRLTLRNRVAAYPLILFLIGCMGCRVKPPVVDQETGFRPAPIEFEVAARCDLACIGLIRLLDNACASSARSTRPWLN